MSLAPAAAAGFQDASAYDAHRPAYPTEAVQKLLDHMRLADCEGARIVEVAAGTGKFTEALAGRVEGFEVLAVEPHPDMRRELEGKALRGVTVRDGRAEDLAGVQDEGADGVVVAQAFHWFATAEALGELHRVLKPGGVLGMIWNIDDYNKPKSWSASTAWAQHLNTWIHTLATRDGNPRFRDMAWQAVFDTAQLKTTPLQILRDTVAGTMAPRWSLPLGNESIAWTHWLGEDALWRRIATLSHVAVLEGAELAAGRRVFAEAMGMADVVRNGAGEVECSGRTFLAWTDRL